MNDVIISIRTAKAILGVLACTPENMRDGDYLRAVASLRMAIKETEYPAEALNERINAIA